MIAWSIEMARFASIQAYAAALALAAGAVLVIIFACGGEQKKAATPASEEAAAPATDGPAAATKCGKDTDCKGDRVCEKGECVSPH